MYTLNDSSILWSFFVFSAKRAAAEALLATLGYSKPQPQPAKPSIKTSNSAVGSNGSENKENTSEGKRKVTFVEVDNSNETTHSHPQGGTTSSYIIISVC